MFAAHDADTDADTVTDADAAFERGAACMRELSQSGLQPANLRLIYGPEVARFVPGSKPLTFCLVSSQRTTAKVSEVFRLCTIDVKQDGSNPNS